MNLSKIKIKTLILSLTLCMAFGNKTANAQSYDFSTFNAPYIELSNDISIINGVVWFDIIEDIPLGFNFEIDSTVFDQLEINWDSELLTPLGLNNRYIINPMGSNLLDRAYNPPTVFPGDTSSLSNISYKTEGTSGNRILKVQWKNSGIYEDYYDDDKFLDSINFQVWLYEVDNSIEFRYGPNYITNAWPLWVLPNGNICAGVGLWDTLNNNWIMQFVNGPGATPTLDSCPILQCTGIIDSIPNGTVYRFSQKMPSSISKTSKVRSLEIYPNPTSGTFNIANIAPYKIKQIEIWNTLGQMSLDLIPNTELDISDLVPGIYSIRVITDEGLYVSKLQKD